MKKDDQEPKKPRKKPQKKSADKLPPEDKKQQSVSKHVINLDGIGRGSLSIGQIAELSKKDKRQLTPYERKALEDANKMARAALEQFSAKYDLTELAKAFAQVQQLPMAKFFDDIRKTLDTTQAFGELLRQNMTRSELSGVSNRSSMSVNWHGYRRLMNSFMLRLPIC